MPPYMQLFTHVLHVLRIELPRTMNWLTISALGACTEPGSNSILHGVVVRVPKHCEMDEGQHMKDEIVIKMNAVYHIT